MHLTLAFGIAAAVFIIAAMTYWRYRTVLHLNQKLTNALEDRKAAEEQFRKYSTHVEQLLQISQKMTSTTDVRQLYRIAVSSSKDILGFDFSTLMILSDDGSRLTIEDTLGFPEPLVGQFSLTTGEGLSTYVARTREAGIVSDFDAETRFGVPDLVRDNGIQSAICVPMLAEGAVLGVLIGHTRGRRDYSQDEVMLYRNIANHAATAVKNALNLEAVRKGEQQLRIITSSMPEGLYVLDQLGHVTYLNAEAERLLGWGRDELNARGLHALVHSRKPDGTPLPLEACCMHNLISTGKRYESNDDVFIRRDGTAFPVSIVASPIFENGAVTAVVTVFRDITRSRKLEQEASKAEKLESIGILAGGMAHDFNNLIQSILGYLSLAKTRDLSPEKRRKFLDHAEDSCHAAAELSGRLITFSKGGSPMKKELSLAPLVQDVVGVEAFRPGIVMDMELPPDLPPVQADEAQMHQVLKNLIRNAVEAMPGGGLLRIIGRTENITGDEPLSLKAGTYLMLSIIDRGVGIPPDDMQKIFDPYFTTKDMGSSRGMGLGLSICHSIMRKHDGAVTIESAPGIGTAAHLFLPLAGGTYVERPVAAVRQEKRPVRKVLFMDDDAGIREMAGDLLEHMGCETALARDGAQAVELYKQALDAGRGFDAVILDLVVPGGMGAEPTMKKILELDPRARGIVTTGYADDVILDDYRGRGFMNVIIKPYDVRQLREMLQGL